MRLRQRETVTERGERGVKKRLGGVIDVLQKGGKVLFDAGS